MKVSGPVGNVVSTTERLALVTFGHQPDYSAVYMYFRGPWRERAVILRKGQNIAVTGQISKIEPYDLHLENCEFDDNRPKG
jgi:hypothetical protein